MSSFSHVFRALSQICWWLLVIILALMAAVILICVVSSFIRLCRNFKDEKAGFFKISLPLLFIVILMSIAPIANIIRSEWSSLEIVFCSIEGIGIILGIISGFLHKDDDFDLNH